MALTKTCEPTEHTSNDARLGIRACAKAGNMVAVDGGGGDGKLSVPLGDAEGSFL